MMSKPSKFLAIEASTERCSVAVSTASVTVSEHCDTPKSHAKVLLPMVDALLQRAELELADVDAILVGTGPGSFTGIRIGISVAQGLAYGANIPLYGSSSLDTLAHALNKKARGQSETDSAIIIPCLDARMKEIYWAAYGSGSGALEVVLPAQVSSAEVLLSYLSAQAGQGIVVGGGHGWSLDDFSGCRTSNIQPELLPHACDLADIWRAKLSSDVMQAPTSVVEPMYLRNQVSWDKRKRVRSHSPFSS